MSVSPTDQERDLLELTAKLWNGFLLLPVLHADDTPEFRHKLHDLQRIILSRSSRLALRLEAIDRLEAATDRLEEGS